MIKKIHITNFKGIKDTVTVELKPITLLFGPNSAGKSTIIQAIHYAKEIFERRNIDPRQTKTGGSSIHLGGFKSLVHNRDIDNSKIALRFDIPFRTFEAGGVTASVVGDVYWEDVKDGYFPEEDYSYDLSVIDDLMSQFVNETELAWIEIEIKWHTLLEKAIVSKFELGINDDYLFRIDESRSTSSLIYYKINEINFDHKALKKIFKDDLESLREILLDEAETFNQEVSNLFYAIPEFKEYFKFKEQFINRLKEEDFGKACNDFLAVIKLFTNHVGNLLLEDLKKFRYIGPIREVPPRNFEPHYIDEEERWANGLAAWDTVYAKRDIIPGINQWLSKLKTGYELVLREYILDPNLIVDHLLKDLGEEIDSLEEYASKKRSESSVALKDFQLWLYKLFVELQGLESSDNKSQIIDKISDLKKMFKDNSFTKMDEFVEQINNSWLNLIAEIGEAGGAFINDYEGWTPEAFKNKDKITRVGVKDINKDLILEPFDIGIGISQVFPIIVGVLTHKSSILAIEQPELHIHPAMQVELADLFIDQINKKDDVVFLLETHSEHLILRMLRRIEETTNKLNKEFINQVKLTKDIIKQLFKTEEGFLLALDNERVAVYYTEQNKDGLQVHHLPLDNTGEFTKNWPKGFFEERAGELFPDE